MVGDECAALRSSLEVTYPVANGIVRNWEDMEHLWDYTFYNKLKVDPNECKVLLTEPPMNPKENRIKLMQKMFETYKFKACYIAIQAVLTLYAQGIFILFVWFPPPPLISSLISLLPPQKFEAF